MVPADEVYDEALAWAGQFRNAASYALRAAKSAIDRGLEVDLDTGLEIERALFASLFAHRGPHRSGCVVRGERSRQGRVQGRVMADGDRRQTDAPSGKKGTTVAADRKVTGPGLVLVVSTLIAAIAGARARPAGRAAAQHQRGQRGGRDVTQFDDFVDGPFGRDTGIFQFHGKNEAAKEALVNWGIAALVYLLVGRVLARVVRP